MKHFNRLIAVTAAVIVMIFTGANLLLTGSGPARHSRPYRVEVNRISRQIEAEGLQQVDLSDYSYVTHVERYGKSSLAAGEADHISSSSSGGFLSPDSDYVLREINGSIYRFDYTVDTSDGSASLRIAVNVILALMSLLVLGVLLYIRRNVLRPFETLTDVPYELSKGNLTTPLREQKSRYFGRFVWGVDLLREHMEEQKSRELAMQKDRKTLLLSLSHDIKTPLSAIKLYAKALSRGLYEDRDRQISIAESINAKADEIECYVSQIIRSSREDFLNLEVTVGEFYLSELMDKTCAYYQEKLSLIKTAFICDPYSDCLLKGDPDRCVEVLQNLMENAIKYGDGRYISIHLAEEDGCQLITVTNSGSSLPDAELPHIFDSFYRGSNAGNQPGSGLGLYICRQLMHRMRGEIFASGADGKMAVTMVIEKP